MNWTFFDTFIRTEDHQATRSLLPAKLLAVSKRQLGDRRKYGLSSELKTIKHLEVRGWIALSSEQLKTIKYLEVRVKPKFWQFMTSPLHGWPSKRDLLCITPWHTWYGCSLERKLVEVSKWELQIPAKNNHHGWYVFGKDHDCYSWIPVLVKDVVASDSS